MNITAVIGAIALAGMSFAQAAPSKKTQQPKAAAQKDSPYSLAPLDPAVDALPPRYAGHSCRSLAKAVSTIKPQKSEFETTAAYKARVDALSSAPMVGTTTLNDVIGLVQAPEVYSGVHETYDADRGVLKLDAHWDGITQSVNNQLLRKVTLDQKLKSTRSYTASNAYGKKVDVDSSRWDACGVAFSNLTYYASLTSGRKNIQESIEMTPDEAKSAKGNLAIVFVGNMSEPYLWEFSDYSKPTIDHPTEMAWGGDLLVMKLVQVWIFNRQSGKIYKKIEID